jgi:hypothetical protein
LSSLKLDLVANYYEFYLHLDTKDVTYFKDLCQQKVLEQQKGSYDTNNSKLEEALSEPLLVMTNMSIYYCTGNSPLLNETLNGSKKHLLTRVELKYVLGYASLKKRSIMKVFDFTLNEEDGEESTDRKDTFSGNLESPSLTLPVSNFGNIDIDVNCYFRLDSAENGDTTTASNSMLEVLKFRNAEIRIEESLMSLPASKQKQNARLVLSKMLKEVTTLGSQKCFLDPDNMYKFIIQVKPDGFQYEFPVRITMQSQVRNSRIDLDSSLDNKSNVSRMSDRSLKENLANSAISIGPAKEKVTLSFVFFGNVNLLCSNVVTLGWDDRT